MKDLETAKTCVNCRHKNVDTTEYPCKDRHVYYGECDRWEAAETDKNQDLLTDTPEM